MAVKATLPNYKSFTFGGANSRSYGVYITGEGVFNAPERNVEMVEIPGRNGAYALDKGNFNNIEVTYPAGIFADNATDFAQAVSDFRNLLCSKTGYVRLEDDYNPNEYRMAIYKSGLEVTHDMLINGEFDIVFECKPQRFLTSGETAVSVASGGTLTNPTLFDAKPQLQVWGYGSISWGGSTITVENVPIGDIKLANSGGSYRTIPPITGLNIGDSFYFTDNLELYASITANKGNYAVNRSATYTNIASATNCTASFGDYQSFRDVVVNGTMPSPTFTYGTASTVTATIVVNVRIELASYPTIDNVVTLTYTVSYDGNETLDVDTSSSYTTTPSGSSYRNLSFYRYANHSDVYGYSTKPGTGNPLYIDLDIGEAWNEDSGVPITLNNSVSIPAELPTLASGANTITYDNTFTQFKVVPRWWKV